MDQIPETPFDPFAPETPPASEEVIDAQAQAVEEPAANQSLASAAPPPAAGGSEPPLRPEVVGVASEPPKKNNNGWIIAIVIVILLCCCCIPVFLTVSVFGKVLWQVVVAVYNAIIGALNSIFNGSIQFY
jgi:hypothetical protein